MANVKIAYAKAHLLELLARVARGERIVISRYNTPMAELVPAPKAQKAQRKFGTGKGKAMLIDRDCAGREYSTHRIGSSVQEVQALKVIWQ